MSGTYSIILQYVAVTFILCPKAIQFVVEAQMMLFLVKNYVMFTII